MKWTCIESEGVFRTGEGLMLFFWTLDNETENKKTQIVKEESQRDMFELLTCCSCVR